MFNALLRDIVVDDLEKVLTWRNQENIRSVMFNNNIIEWEQHKNWYEKIKNSKNNISKIFTVNNVDYGILNIYDIDNYSNKCSWGFYIGDNNAPKGTGVLLGYTSLEFVFKELKFRKLCAEVIETNKISCNFHKKLGFKLDGILRKQIKRNDRYEDIYVYSLFAEEWEDNKKQLNLELKGHLNETNISREL
ncbi:UDP-4-amino-4,6-dideoxy-N-acetyl-beta-L-altrosamine N-acetyltransferase [Lysinibacillus fusiformis]|uniref:UDP-4-amino-4, 6-dideoxy-N-acetyl-beta-L-altrosamine N-acetyltransferase n=1 Tax=Lysinibacillus fusiformis TaxID=28031 RepID=UPI0036F11C10